MKPKQPERTTVHLMLKRELLEQIDKLATVENRSRLNMITTLLQQALSKR